LLPAGASVVLAGRATSVPFTAVTAGPQRTTTDNTTAATTLRRSPPPQVTILLDLALGAEGRVVEANIGAAGPADPVLGRGGSERRRCLRPETFGPRRSPTVRKCSGRNYAPDPSAQGVVMLHLAGLDCGSAVRPPTKGQCACSQSYLHGDLCRMMPPNSMLDTLWFGRYRVLCPTATPVVLPSSTKDA
jgi:hypothetical protein